MEPYPPKPFGWTNSISVSAATQGYGVPTKNKTIDGKPLTIAGKTFERGFGSHAESSITILLNGEATEFTAQVGIDDEVKGQRPAAEFVVYGDGKKLWSSGVMHLGDTARVCTVRLEGIQKMELNVTDGGNGNYYDHVDWANAKFQTTGTTMLKTYNAVATEPYILTPPPASEPKITGAKVFGVRPGSPFLFLVTATGDRPLTFSASGLPKGLKLDAKTGNITGKLLKKGTYLVNLTAKNAKGKAQRQLRVECGDRISLTPPMGWNSWKLFCKCGFGRQGKKSCGCHGQKRPDQSRLDVHQH